MEKEFQFSGKAAIAVGIILIAGIVIRFLSFSDATDALLEEKVRDVLWSTYSGIHLSAEINTISREQDYDKVPSLLDKASPDAITIERISRSEPLLSWSSNQVVIVRVRYRFPEDTETRIEYMKFKHGSMLKSWSYSYDTSAISYYLNFF